MISPGSYTSSFLKTSRYASPLSVLWAMVMQSCTASSLKWVHTPPRRELPVEETCENGRVAELNAPSYGNQINGMDIEKGISISLGSVVSRVCE
jgi:hypothetical protein